ncbi:MAG: hypothetical protein V7603_5727 [Micromonosporaceae bacterium]
MTGRVRVPRPSSTERSRPSLPVFVPCAKLRVDFTLVGRLITLVNGAFPCVERRLAQVGKMVPLVGLRLALVNRCLPLADLGLPFLRLALARVSVAGPPRSLGVAPGGPEIAKTSLSRSQFTVNVALVRLGVAVFGSAFTLGNAASAFVQQPLALNHLLVAIIIARHDTDGTSPVVLCAQGVRE